MVCRSASSVLLFCDVNLGFIERSQQHVDSSRRDSAHEYVLLNTEPHCELFPCFVVLPVGPSSRLKHVLLSLIEYPLTKHKVHGEELEEERAHYESFEKHVVRVGQPLL